MKIEHVQVLGVDKKVKVNAGHFSNALYDTYLNMSVDVELTDPYIIHGYVKSATSGSITISVGNDSSTYTTKNEWLEVIMKISKISSQEINFIFSKGEYWIYNWKLEKGSNETAWTPSPLDAKFDLVQLGSEVTQLSNKIEQKVWQTDIDTASKTINKSVSLVGQDAKKIYWLIDENSKTQASMSFTKNVYSLIAENIDLTGRVTFSCFDSSAQKRVTDVEDVAKSAKESANTAQSTANSATSAANNAQSTADGIIKNIYVTNKTTINGGKIETGTVTADAIATDAIISKNYVKDSTGSFLNLSDGSFDSKYLKWDKTGAITAVSGNIGGWRIGEKSIYSSYDYNDMTYDVSLHKAEKPSTHILQVTKEKNNVFDYTFFITAEGKMCSYGQLQELGNTFNSEACLFGGYLKMLDTTNNTYTLIHPHGIHARNKENINTLTLVSNSDDGSGDGLIITGSAGTEVSVLRDSITLWYQPNSQKYTKIGKGYVRICNNGTNYYKDCALSAIGGIKTDSFKLYNQNIGWCGAALNRTPSNDISFGWDGTYLRIYIDNTIIASYKYNPGSSEWV